MKRIFIIHGWEGFPEEGWFPWLKKELENKGYEVQVPSMPNTEEPEMKAWISHLKQIVGTVDEETFFVGHSIGCQTILRYLQEQDSESGGVILVAGWVHLKGLEDEESEEIAKPWLETPLEWDKIKNKSKSFTVIFSDNDPFVPQEDSKIFEEKLNAKIITEHKKGHFSGEDNIKQLPVVLDLLS